MGLGFCTWGQNMDKWYCWRRFAATQVFGMTWMVRHGWFVEGCAVPSVHFYHCEKQEVPHARSWTKSCLRVEVNVPTVEQALKQSESPTLVFTGGFSTATEIPVRDVVEVKALIFYCFNTGTDTESVKELMASEMLWVQLIVGSIDYSAGSYHLDLI